MGMLIEHLEEEGIVMQEVDAKQLIGFLKRMVCSHSGAGVLAGNLDGPHELSKLMRNVKLLSARFNPDFKAAWQEAGEKFDPAKEREGSKEASVDISVMPRVNTGFDREKLVDEDGNIHWKARDGGDVFVRAQHSLGNGKHWLRVGYGFWLCVDKSVSHRKPHLPKAFIYAWSQGGWQAGGSELYSEKTVNFELITDKAADSMDAIEAKTAKQVKTVLDQLKDNAASLSPKQNYAISKLRKKLARYA